MILLQSLLAFIAIFAFAAVSYAPKRQYFFCGLCGGLAWGTCCFLEMLGIDKILSVLFATFFLTVFSRTLSILQKTPVTIYLMTGVLPLVPGAGIYYTSYYFIMNEANTAAHMGLDAFKTAGAISLGIIFGFAVPILHLRK
ncbi:MAG: threonine/serine exporter family protein [Lachnospiraceae bacterium]